MVATKTDEVVVDAESTGRLTSDNNLVRVSTRSADIFLYPFEDETLIKRPRFDALTACISLELKKPQPPTQYM